MRNLAENAIEELWFGEPDPNRSDEDASASMAAAAAKANGLKPFPAVAHRVMSLLEDPEVDLEEVRKLIENDAALASRLLRIANSSAFGSRYKIGSIVQAIMRLGSIEVQELVASVACLGMFEDSFGVGIRFRDHCGGVAALVRTLAEEWRQKSVPNTFLCALLHDIGKLLSMQVGEIDYPKMDVELFRVPDRMHLAERAEAGYDHAVLGAHVIEQWNLPRNIARIVGWHHRPGRAYEVGGNIGLTVAFIRVADAIEVRMHEHPELDEAFIEELTNAGDCKYIDLSKPVLVAMWPKLVDSWRDMKSAHFR